MPEILRFDSKQTGAFRVRQAHLTVVLHLAAVITLLLTLSACTTIGGGDTKNMTPEQKASLYAKPYKPKSIMIPQLNDTIATVEMSWKDGEMFYSLIVDKSFDLQAWLEEHPKGNFVVTWEKDGTTFGGFDAPFKDLKKEGKDLKYSGHAPCGLDKYDDLYANRDYWGLTWEMPGD